METKLDNTTKPKHDAKLPVMGSYSPSWGKWECPTCKVEMLDPSDIFGTVCDNGHLVKLGIVQSNGVRETFE